jgi:glycosyltransferase involved in cell wall biosynthesis
MKYNCTVIIPFFNEGYRILKVLGEISRIKGIKIICVDDGSTDESFNLVKKRFPSIKIIKININSGKSNAIIQGLKEVKTKFVMLIDADLQKINYKDYELGLKKINEKKKIDMIIFKRNIAQRLYIRMNRGDVLISGERLIKTNLLKKALLKNPKNYELELKMNKYFFENKKKCFWMNSVAKNTIKSMKVGFIKGMYQDLKMYFSIVRSIGIVGYMFQVFLFCREELD